MLRIIAALLLVSAPAMAQERPFDAGEEALAILSEHVAEVERLGARVVVRQYRIAPGVRAARLERIGGGLLLVQLRSGELATVIDGERRERLEGEWWSVENASDMELQTEDDSVVIEAISVLR